MTSLASELTKKEGNVSVCLIPTHCGSLYGSQHFVILSSPLSHSVYIRVLASLYKWIPVANSNSITISPV